MPDCTGSKPCKIGHPHQLSVEALLKGKSDAVVRGLASRKNVVLVGPCGGKFTFGRRARAELRRKSKVAVSALPLSQDRIQKDFDDLFLSRMGEIKAPGVYLYKGKLPLAFVSVDEKGQIVSREVFAAMAGDVADRVTMFIKAKIPDAIIRDEAAGMVENVSDNESGKSENKP